MEENKIHRSRVILHPSGEKIETPLLVPSFSSKGFSLLNTKDGVMSECHEVMRLAPGFIDESLLVSAYDIYHDLIPKPIEFKSAKINFIDSGGYETSQLYDLSGINKFNHGIKEWNIEHLREVLANWPKEMSGIMVSYDHGDLRLSIDEQVENAQKLFYEHKSLMNDFLIKPETKEQSYVQISNLLAKPELLNGFNIIGVTEKEIGNSQLNRMVNIALLRRAMDKVGNMAPIHIFGSLDPLNVILYFLAGAEIFDGLTWLKFSYHQGAAIYIQNYSILSPKYGIESKDMSMRLNFWVDNTIFLTKLKHVLINFNADGDYDHFTELDNGIFKLAELVEKLHIKFMNKLKSN